MAEGSQQTEPERRRPTSTPPPPHPSGWRSEGAPDGGGTPPQSGFRPPGGRAFWWVLVGLLVLNVLIVQLVPRETNRLDVPYTTFRAQVQAGNVSEITSTGNQIQGTFKKSVT